MNATARNMICALLLLASTIVVAAQPGQPQPQQAEESTVTRTDFIATMDTEFRAKDLDHDGKVTRAEIEAGERAKTLAAAQAQNRAIFAQLDTDHNGVLYPNEFAGLVQNPPLPDVGPIMNRLDTNRDQVVTLVEYRAATLANFDRLDTDHDGIVTAAEMRAGGIAPTGR